MSRKMFVTFGGKLHFEGLPASMADVLRIDWQQGEHSRIPGIDPLWYVLRAWSCLLKAALLTISLSLCQDAEPFPVSG